MWLLSLGSHWFLWCSSFSGCHLLFSTTEHNRSDIFHADCGEYAKNKQCHISPAGHCVHLLCSPEYGADYVVEFGLRMFKTLQIQEMIFSGALLPVKILYMYPLSTNRPVSRETICSSSHWLIPRWISSVFTHNPKSVNLLFCTKYHLPFAFSLTSTWLRTNIKLSA